MVQQSRRTQIELSALGIIGQDDSPGALSSSDFERLVLSDPDRNWELYDGVAREKPGMSTEHNDIALYLAVSLANQLDRRQYRVRSNSSHVRRSPRRYYMPDVCVVPAGAMRERAGPPGQLEVFDEPLPLVVDVWSRSTGTYDADTKIPEYKNRGDLEIWRLHPYERTLTVWRKQADGSYDDELFHGGTVEPTSLPGVQVDLDALFDLD